MGVMLESEIQHDRSVSLVLREATKTDRWESIVGYFLWAAWRATGRHDCVAVRGVKCHEAQMTTVALRGLFREKPSLVEEFHQILTRVDR